MTSLRSFECNMIQIHQLKSDHHVSWGGFNGEHLHVDHIYYMTHVRPFGLLCSEAMFVHARLVKFNLSVPHVQHWLAPVVCERRVYHTRSSWRVSKRWTFATVHTRGEHNLSWNLSEGSPYNATVVLSKIRCIKGLTSHANHKWHDMAMNLCFWSPSPKHRHDLHRHRHDTMISIILISINVSPWGCRADCCFYDYC